MLRIPLAFYLEDINVLATLGIRLDWAEVSWRPKGLIYSSTQTLDATSNPHIRPVERMETDKVGRCLMVHRY